MCGGTTNKRDDNDDYTLGTIKSFAKCLGGVEKCNRNLYKNSLNKTIRFRGAGLRVALGRCDGTYNHILMSSLACNDCLPACPVASQPTDSVCPLLGICGVFWPPRAHTREFLYYIGCCWLYCSVVVFRGWKSERCVWLAGVLTQGLWTRRTVHGPPRLFETCSKQLIRSAVVSSLLAGDKVQK